MFRTDVVDVINSGDTWLFVGSGVSSDSGLPSWEELVKQIAFNIGKSASSDNIAKDARFIKGLQQRDFIRCFSRIEHHAGREALEDALRESIVSITPAEGIVDMLVDWPFAGYVTTNYDHIP